MPEQKPIIRMQNFVAQKMETLELCYSALALDGTTEWKTEMAKYDHTIFNDIHKTLVMIEAIDGEEFRKLLHRKLGARKKT